MVEALVGCVAGAVLVSDTGRMARDAGLTDIALKSKARLRRGDDELGRPALPENRRAPAGGAKPSDYITSLEVQARKPVAACCGDD